MKKHHFEQFSGILSRRIKSSGQFGTFFGAVKSALTVYITHYFTTCPDVPNIFLFNGYREIKRIENKKVVKNKFQILFTYRVTVQLGYFFGTSGQNRLAYL